ncbi:MAG: HAD-IC family P-type ATPase [Actinomycetota bacterium]|nr:HAD-IC family P-type ATPase [Actinomycetota bacterium]
MNSEKSQSITAWRNEYSGLSAEEVARRTKAGQTNRVRERASRSYSDILRANIFTRFNAILGALFVAILIFGNIRDGLFALVLVANTLIGIVQEIRAKVALDRLSIIGEAFVRVLRDGELSEISPKDLVLDDTIYLRTGDQISVDCTVVESASLEVDESLLTGESIPVTKKPKDEVLSGSFVVSGAGICRATRVGEEAYARKLASEAKSFALTSSELMNGINLILRYITYLFVPVGLLLFSAQVKYFGFFGKAVPGTVAGLVGMVPQGLVLLTSVTFAVSVLTLSTRNCLVSELPAVEGLARVDVICLDKTGTLTEGKIKFVRSEPLGTAKDIEDVLSAFAQGSSSESSTLSAIREAFGRPAERRVVSSVPFSSARKWSSLAFEDGEKWVMGAPEILIENAGEDACQSIKNRVGELAREGFRVVMLARAAGGVSKESINGEIIPEALLLFEERIRPDARQTLEYFAQQDVKVKVISGDDPRTALAVARKAGLTDAETSFDARQLPSEPEALRALVEETVVFGRVSPEQKRKMVEALQEAGHVVAMTGDGVNDVLALKKSDIGVAMGSGAPATRAVAQLVLVDGRFENLPGVVKEGRRVIRNMERVANLFITKTVYSTLLSIAIGVFGWAFIFLPRHLTLVSALTIGTPAFILSFSRSEERYRPGFVVRVMRFAIPAGIVAALAAFASGAISHLYPWVSLGESRTLATIVLVVVALWVLSSLVRPFDFWRATLVFSLAFCFVLVFLIPPLRSLFALEFPGGLMLIEALFIDLVSIFLLEAGWRISGWGAKRGKPDLIDVA